LPKSGFKSITVSKTTYTAFENVYKELQKNNSLPPGIHSFAGYVTYRIENEIEEEKRWKKLASKIKFVHPKFTTTTMQIKIPKF